MSFSMSRCNSEPYLLEKEESRRFCSDPWLASDPYKGLLLQAELQLTSCFVKRVVVLVSHAEWLSSPCRILIVCPLKLFGPHTAHPEECLMIWSGAHVITIEINCTINVWIIPKPPPYPSLWKDCPPWDFPGGIVERNLPANAGDTGFIPGLGRFHTPQRNNTHGPRAHALQEKRPRWEE